MPGSPDMRADAVRPHRHELMCWLGQFERRTLQTARGRIQTAKRLERRGHAWTAALVGLVLLTLLGSILDLAFSSATPVDDQVVVIAFSVIALAGSLVVANREYGVRAARMASNYKQMQSLSAEVEIHRTRSHEPDFSQARAWMQRYDALLEAAENHTTADYRAALKANRPDPVQCTCEMAAQEGATVEEPEGGRRSFSVNPELIWSYATSSLPWLVLFGSYAYGVWYLLSRTQA